LLDSGLDSRYLELEITESMVMRDVESAKPVDDALLRQSIAKAFKSFESTSRGK
jgi:hypothetical protein